MDIKIYRVPPEEMKPKPKAGAALGFGKIFSDHMFVMDYEQDQGWINPRIQKFANFSISPAALVFHYAQECFEGMKGYYRADGNIGLFRPEMNFNRFNRSCQRIVMPEIPIDMQRRAVSELLKLEKDWIPRGKGESMYIRPTMIATQEVLGVKDSSSYCYFIILSPSGAYYSKGFNPIRVMVSEKYSRAAAGGVGNRKVGGNYAASLLAGKEAIAKNCDQVLWLDSNEHKYIEEVGSMNIFFVIDGKVVTSRITGTILEGVTRDSVLKLAPTLGYEVEERDLAIGDIIEGIESGSVTECFGSGTAAIISPVSELNYKDKLYTVSDGVGPVSQKLFDELVGIQYGMAEDKFSWTHIVE